MKNISSHDFARLLLANPNGELIIGQETPFMSEGPLTTQLEIKFEDGVVWVEDRGTAMTLDDILDETLGADAALFKEELAKHPKELGSGWKS